MHGLLSGAGIVVSGLLLVAIAEHLQMLGSIERDVRMLRGHAETLAKAASSDES